MPEIQVDRDDLFVMLNATVRYALGRRSYVVSQACDLVRRYGKRLTAAEMGVLRRDIADELRAAELRQTTCGHPCDHDEWQRLLTWMGEPLS